MIGLEEDALDVLGRDGTEDDTSPTVPGVSPRLEPGRRCADETQQSLVDLLRTTRDPDLAARAAGVLETAYCDDTGLRMFQGDLGVLDEETFVRAWELYRHVEPKRRGAQYLARIGRALERQVKPDHLVALLELLRWVDPGPELGVLVVPWLADQRRARGRLLERRVRLGDVAAECLLEALGTPRPRGLWARLRYRRLRKSLRSRVRTSDDWDRLLRDKSAALVHRQRREEEKSG